MKVCPRCRASHPDEFAFCPRDATPLVEVEPWSFGSLHGGYQILDAVEGDGPGERFRALHRESGERRIVRVLEGWWLASSPAAERFRQEIARAPLLQHPNAARVDGLFEPAGDRPFVVEEEAWGPSLRQVLDAAARPVSLPWVCLLARQIAGALEAAHALGLVRGAVRPQDVVFLDPAEPMECKVLGFGAGALGDTAERDGLAGPDPRSDLFSLGALLFEILTGLPVPAPLARLVGRLLEPDSDRRPRSAREVLAELTAVEEEMRRSVAGYLWAPGSAIRGRYRLLAEPIRDEVLERFSARDLKSGRRVCLVVLAPWLAADPDLAAAFRRQGASLSAVHHEHLANVLATGESEDGRPFVIEEEVHGIPLSWIAEGRAPLELPRACRLLAGLARGLEALHRHGHCHGRLHAAAVVLVDTPFGERPRLLHIWEHAVRRRLDATIGTETTAPEILAGGGEDPRGRTDLYALGVLAWETVARRPVFLAETPREALHRHATVPAPPLSAVRAGIPPALNALVARLLEKKPARRPGSAGEVAAAFERLAERPAVAEVADGVATAADRPPFGAVGSVVAGRFRIERRIGGGGLGQVFAVTDLGEGGRWALKLLCRERFGAVPVERVVRAVEPLTRLRHPGVVALREAGEAEDGSPFLLFEPVEGPDLQELTFPVSLDAICTVARDIAEALGAIHARGGIHGDLKPRHARLACAEGGRRWRLLDAGLAAALAALVPGTAAGTPGYLAPERSRPDCSALPSADPRSDLYSLGVILHELICGRLPDGGRPRSLTPRGGARIPERLQLLVLRLVEPDPRRRPASAQEVCDELAAVAAGLRSEEIGDTTAVLRSPLLKTAVLAPRTGRLLAARALQRQKTDQQAEESYRAALLGDAQNPFLHAFLGRSLGRQERWSEAAEAYRRALHLDPFLGPAWGRLHEALCSLGDEAGARAVRARGHAAWWSLAAPVRRRIDGDAAKLAAVAFSPDGAHLASAGINGAVWLWNVRTGRAEQVLGSSQGQSGAQALAFSPRAPLAASAGRDGTVCLWNMSAGALAARLKGHSDAVRAVAFSRDGRAVASGGAGGKVRVWGSADHRPRSVHTFSSPVNAVAFGPDGALLVAGADGTLEIVDLADREEAERRLSVRAHGEPVTTAAFSADGGLAASGSVDRTVKLWDAATGDLVATLRGHDAAVSAVAFLPGGLLLASAGFDATVRLWDLFEGKLRDTFPTEAGFLTSLAVSPDGTTLAAGTDLPRIELWGSPLP
jgi:serine/threonine protein kinase